MMRLRPEVIVPVAGRQRLFSLLVLWMSFVLVAATADAMRRAHIQRAERRAAEERLERFMLEQQHELHHLTREPLVAR